MESTNTFHGMTARITGASSGLIIADLLAPIGTVALFLLAGTIQRIDLASQSQVIEYSGEQSK